MFRTRPVMILAVAMPVLLVVLLGISGYLVFTKAPLDPVTKADAIIVLGGEHDGREAYGLELASEDVANTVVLSDPYGVNDKVMNKYCASSTAAVEVMCVPPEPSTTRGEAIFTENLAKQRGWKHVIVISWRYHLPRARYIFSECFGGEVTMQAVPRRYDFSLATWEYTYLYQIAGFIKAAVQGSCSTDSD